MAMHARLVRSSSYGRPCLRPVLLLGVLVLSLVLSLAACGGGTSSGTFQPNGSLAGNTPPASAPDAQAPSALPTAQVNKTVLARYAEFRRVYSQAYRSNDPARLAAVAVDPILAETTRSIESFQAKNEVWRFTTVSNARIYGRSRDGLTVYVIDCLRTLGAYRYSLRTGKRIGTIPEESSLHRTAVRYVQGTWKVSDSVRDKRC